MWEAVSSLEVLGVSRQAPQQQQGASTAGQDAKVARVLPPAASKGYSVASIWERNAQLSDTQQRAIEVLGATCSQRPLPEHVQAATASAAATPTAAPSGEGAADGPLSSAHAQDLSSFEDVTLQNSSEFYKWLSELEAARASEAESKYQRHAAVLEGHLAACDSLLATVDEALQVFAQLRDDHRAVSARTAALHTTCERLVSEREALVQAAEAIRSKLTYFDELESVAAQFHAAGPAAGGTDVMPLLQRLDECLDYVMTHPQYADAAAYSVKFRQLQARALTTVRSRVQGALRAAAAAVVQAQRSGGPPAAGDAANGEAPVGDGAETTLLHVRFRAAAEPSLKGLLAGIEARAATSVEYARLLRDCQASYAETRLALMRAPVAARVRGYRDQPLPTLARSGCAYLLQVAQMERQLYEQLFPGSISGGPAAAGGGGAPPGAVRLPTAAALAPLIDPLCTLLYDMMRPYLVSVKDVDQLVELAEIVRSEVLEGGGVGGRRSEAATLLEPVLRRALADVQERLSYRAQSFVREAVAGFVPGPADLEYPGKLLAATREEEIVPANGAGGEEEALAASSQVAEQAQYAGWYPPVQRALLLLSKLYRVVPPKTFNGLAQEAVAAATAAVQDAEASLTASQGPVHAQLFTIKQLLILRAQIAPFEADFSVTERDLDFSHMRDYLRRTLSGQLFSSGGVVRTAESQLDAKKELERRLKATCEAFIMHVTKLTVEPMLSFLTKVTAVRVSGGGAASEAKPLREQAFAAPERVAEVVASVRAALTGALPEAVAAMQLYLPAATTQGVLFKPIKSNVVEAHGQLAALLEGEYSAEEVAAAGLPLPDQLAAQLDAML